MDLQQDIKKCERRHADTKDMKTVEERDSRVVKESNAESTC